MVHAALHKPQWKILKTLLGLKSFTLAGGSALALQIGHRQSNDLDFFSSRTISPSLIKQIQRLFPTEQIQPIISTGDELTVFLEGVKVTFLFYPFPVLFKPLVEDNVTMFAPKEIAAMKSYTIGRRGSLKDYVDLYFLIKEKYTTLEEIVSMAEKKYQEVFNGRLLLEQLVFFDDIPDDKIVFLKHPVSREKLRCFFEQAIRRFR
ncbi:MAG: nucleotidyl transferase AbiEii/AbiGii toxin family protein, partial [bacterium]|nr:nucleotidyl transferase AbiEii/AbiGii toxin family protein [bacterium]